MANIKYNQGMEYIAQGGFDWDDATQYHYFALLPTPAYTAVPTHDWNTNVYPAIDDPGSHISALIDGRVGTNGLLASNSPIQFTNAAAGAGPCNLVWFYTPASGDYTNAGARAMAFWDTLSGLTVTPQDNTINIQIPTGLMQI